MKQLCKVLVCEIKLSTVILHFKIIIYGVLIICCVLIHVLIHDTGIIIVNLNLKKFISHMFHSGLVVFVAEV